MQLRGELAALEGRCASLSSSLKSNQFEMNALQHEINRLTELEDIRENNRIFIRQNQDVMARQDELQREHHLLKEQHRLEGEMEGVKEGREQKLIYYFPLGSFWSPRSSFKSPWKLR